MNYITTHQKPPLSFPSVSGSIVTFNSQYAGLPLKSHSVEVVATQSGSGTPSPDNVRTINGYSAINIANAREDLYHDITVQNGYLDILGNVQASGISSVTDYIPVVEGLVYYYYDYATAALGPRNICIYDDSKQFVSYIAYETVNKKVYFSIPSNGAYIRITIDRNYTIQHLYNGTTTTIQIGSTVYGGTYNAITGILTVTHGFATYDGSADENWTNVLGAFNIIIDEAEQIQTPMCNLFNPMSSRALGFLNDLECAFANVGAKNLNFKYSSASDLTEWKSFLSANNIQVCYELATPTTIQLPPCPIETLEVNNIWADTGDTTLQYPKFG